MRSSMIFQHVIRVAFWPLIILSLFLYYRGHNLPGGGFVGGLVGSSAFCLWAYAFGVRSMKDRMWVDPLLWIIAGLGFAYGSGYIGLHFGREFLQGLWMPELPVIGHLGTPNLFDLGVYCLVIGMVTLIVGHLFEDIGEGGL